MASSVLTTDILALRALHASTLDVMFLRVGMIACPNRLGEQIVSHGSDMLFIFVAKKSALFQLTKSPLLGKLK